MPTAPAAPASGLGQRTDRLHKKAPGHVKNRPQAPLVSDLVDQGVVKDADVDSGLCWRPGLRRVSWSKSCSTISAAAPAIAFGPFPLLPTRRLLLEGEKPVRLGSRAFDLLVDLVERAGELVSREELMARVWPNTFVEEVNLKVQVAGLRRVLGDRWGSNRYLATIPGRGYRFVAPVTIADVRSTPAARAHNLPAQIVRMIDRTDAIAALAAQLQRRRLVTIVGPGGIGKTTVALAVAGGCSERTSTASDSSIRRPLSTRASCRARSLTRSARTSAQTTRPAA
jgi:DNA-binding winged helix-turn-helix (wHTH) protein